MQAAKKGFLNVIYGILGQVITIVLGIVIPRLVLVSYGSEINGLLNSVSQIFVYFGLLEAGVGMASLQALYVPISKDDKKSINGIMVATHNFYKKAGYVYVAAVLGLAFIYPLCVKMSCSYWLVAGVILFGGLGNSINFLYQGKYKILMQAEGYSYIITNITTLIGVISSCAKVILLLIGFDVLAVQFSFFVISILQMIIYAVYVKKKYKWIDFSTEPNDIAIKQKNSTLIHQIAAMVFNNTDVLLLTFLTQDLKIVSIYTMYNMIVTMLINMIQQVEGGFSFKLGQIYNTDFEQYKRLHEIFQNIYLILIFTAMSCVYIVITPFMRLYTAGIDDINYLDRWYPLLFTLWPLLVYGRAAENNVISFAGHFKQTQWRAVMEVVINLSVSVVCILKFGIYGALFGTIVASLYRTNDVIIYAYKYLLKKSPIGLYAKWGVCLGIYGLIVKFSDYDNVWITNYFYLVGFAAIVGTICLLIYSIVQIIIDPKTFCYIKEIMKVYLENKKMKSKKSNENV